ncbi:hypothetical protein Hypma_008239 [Hypsizygus marmoreus]|uniref:F-box domain-containing protein n=1 Tax=Hypsizygus marmoreus TaxID=39966 RepID=A0A369JW61_HYPMA|nr:hypothetical protein Hypma_008239 [Hypsizygus marmoreus]
MSLVSNRDILCTVIDKLLVSQWSDIFTLSLVSTTLREITAPLLFKHVKNRRNWRTTSTNPPIGEVWPATIWKYIARVDVYDRLSPMWPVGDVDFGPLALTLPQLQALRHVCFELEGSPPNILLSAIASARYLNCLEFKNARFDGPSVVQHFSHMPLESLKISIGHIRDENIDVEQEEANVAEILTVLAEQLVHLEISGDLVPFRVLRDAQWPNLLTLLYTDHVPFGDIIPLPAVTSRMPRLQTLGYNFAAAARWYKPGFTFCPKHAVLSPLLSDTQPHLQVLTMSNIVSDDTIFDQLPPGLRVLRVLALRDDLRYSAGENKTMPFYPYFPITHRDAYRILDKASQLHHLVELAITLEDCPSPNLMSAVAQSCPGLCILELTQGRYDLNEEESPYTIQSLAQPLMAMKSLHDLRITVWFGEQSAGVRTHATNPEVKIQIEAAAQVFAEILPQLATISFSFTNLTRYDNTCHPLTWYHVIVRDRLEGCAPVTQFDGYREYYSHT